VDELPNENGIWIYFETENLDEYVQKLTNNGFSFEDQTINLGYGEKQD